MISTMQLQAIMPLASARITSFIQPLNDAMDAYQINTPKRQAAFLAQIAHESGELRYMRELADGKAYEGRADLGNTHPGDGPLFRGRGLLQVTGRNNYSRCGIALGLDLLTHPELLEQPDGACKSAGWFWRGHGLNELSDTDKFGTITKTVNGGYNGLDQRLAYWLRARTALGL